MKMENMYYYVSLHSKRILMLKINPSSAIPIYEQLVSEIKRMIKTGELKTGDSLPPIRTLASQLDVAVNTVARAYQELDSQGLAEGNRRKGSFVKKQAPDLSKDTARIFKDSILILIQQGLSKGEIESLFQSNLQQIFD